MAPTKAWETIPSADFASKLNWRSLGENRYAALRVRLLILQTNGSESRFGRVMHAVNVAPHDSIAFRSKRSRVISQTTTITEAIRFATASRVCEKLAAKVSAELGGKLAGFAGKLRHRAACEHRLRDHIHTGKHADWDRLIRDSGYRRRRSYHYPDGRCRTSSC